MADHNNEKNPSNVKMLSIEELKTYPGNENKSDAELMEQAEFLKEFSLILYAAYVKNQNNTNFNF